MGTGKNDIFVRKWWEVDHCNIDFDLQSINQLETSEGRYFPYNKGGEYRLWYGNLLEVLWFDEEGRKYMNSMSGHRENGGHDYYFRHGLTWTFISSSRFGVRSLPYGFLFDVAGSTLFVNDEELNYVLGFLSSAVCNEILKLLNPTLNYQAGNVKSLPVLIGHKSEIDELVDENISISKDDWNSFEISWDGDVGRCYEFYKDELAEAGIEIPSKDELPADQVDCLMGGLADEVEYEQPVDMDAYLQVIDSTVRAWIIEGLEHISDCFEDEFPVWKESLEASIKDDLADLY